MRRFYIDRKQDATGVSGTGRVAEGCLFTNGWVALTWLTEHTSVVFYPSIEDVKFIHGHNGMTTIVWQDSPINMQPRKCGWDDDPGHPCSVPCQNLVTGDPSWYKWCDEHQVKEWNW